MKNNNHLVIITMPHSRVLKLISRSVLLSVLLLLFFPWIHNSNPIHHDHIRAGLSNNSTYLPLLFQDLFNQHLFKSGDRALLLLHTPNGNGHGHNVIVSINNHHHIQSLHHSFIPRHDTFDLVITTTTSASSQLFIQPSLKLGGILALQLPPKPLNIPDNYKIVYVRRFHNNTILAIRKLSSTHPLPLVGTRRLLERTLDGLEDVMFEPPRPGNHFRSPKINYLPDLTGDSLDAYPHRVFIDGGGSTSSIQWFKNNYPTRNTHFHIYNIHMVLAPEESLVPHPRLSEWLWKNVKEGEYVVMKAEADAVEDMLRTGAIGLVDELFLECNHQWDKGSDNNTRRPYWECLALYGRLRDQGIAVHQWWES